MNVTVLLAVYNGEKYLPEQLMSLSDQSYKNFNVLYQDDGSADSSVEILENWSLQDSRFRAAHNQGKHMGPVGNFFSLLSQADGDLIFFSDQDDIWEPQKISLMVDAFLQQKPADNLPLLIHSDASVISENGETLFPSFFRLQGWDPAAVQLNRLLVQNNVTGCMMMVNRALADLVLRYGNPETMFMHDWFFALSASAFGKIIFLDQSLTRYRQHSGNAIGASRSSLIRRGFKALSEKEKVRQRINLTYTHSRSFLETYGDSLPENSLSVVERYLSTQSMPKISRILSIKKQGCLMQSSVTRFGQILFG